MQFCASGGCNTFSLQRLASVLLLAPGHLLDMLEDVRAGGEVPFAVDTVVVDGADPASDGGSGADGGDGAAPCVGACVAEPVATGGNKNAAAGDGLTQLRVTPSLAAAVLDEWGAYVGEEYPRVEDRAALAASLEFERSPKVSMVLHLVFKAFLDNRKILVFSGAHFLCLPAMSAVHVLAGGAVYATLAERPGSLGCAYAHVWGACSDTMGSSRSEQAGSVLQMTSQYLPSCSRASAASPANSRSGHLSCA